MSETLREVPLKTTMRGCPRPTPQQAVNLLIGSTPALAVRCTLLVLPLTLALAPLPGRPPPQAVIMSEILREVPLMSKDQYGNYVIQHIIERGLPAERQHVGVGPELPCMLRFACAACSGISWTPRTHASMSVRPCCAAHPPTPSRPASSTSPPIPPNLSHPNPPPPCPTRADHRHACAHDCAHVHAQVCEQRD